MRNPLLMLSVALLDLSCADRGAEPLASDRRFNTDPKYGVGARNDLTTFDKSIRKDLARARMAVVSTILKDFELDSLEGLLMRIGVFDWPDTPLLSRGGLLGSVAPVPTYIWHTESESQIEPRRLSVALGIVP